MLHKPISSQSKAWLLYACLLMLMASCSKCNKVVEPDKTSTASLPAATQTGAGTFGCMLNGQAWLPVRQGRPLEKPNPSLNYDETFEGGSIGVQATDYSNQPIDDTIGFSGSFIGNVGEYNLANSNIRFSYYGIDDAYYSYADMPSSGKLTITKLDKTNKIIAGTFSFTIEKTAKNNSNRRSF